MKQYPAEAINQFTRHVLRDTAGFNWLIEHGYKELLATLDAIRDDKEAFKFLLKNNYQVLAAFVNAIWDDDKAMKFLLDLKQFEWAACANIINGDEKAEAFLKNTGRSQYVALAHAIQSRIHEDGDRMTTPIGVLKSIFNFKNIFKKDADN
jgi:hypothetical protein